MSEFDKNAFALKNQREIEEIMNLRVEAARLLAQIVAKWDKTPESAHPFDFRVVGRSREVVERLKKIDLGM